MIISILTGGSRGDVQPYIALGKGLQKAGYGVKLIASDDFEVLVKESGLEFASTGFSVKSVLDSDEWRATAEKGNFLTIVSKMQKEMKRQAQTLASSLPDLLEGTDYMLTGVGGLGGGFSLAEKLNIPYIQAYVFPITPTTAYASPLTPNLPFGTVLNPFSFRVLRQMLWMSTRSADVETRRIFSMKKSPLLAPFGKLEKQPTIYGYSQHILPAPADWRSNHHVTGYWFLDESSDWTPPADFIDFMNAGEKPVYIGFGSMLNKNPEQVAEIVLDALEMSGQRGVISSGWGGISQSDLPETVHMISSMPHSWLFPRMKAVVHHGGAGTTAAGVRAGVPSIIVPFMGDQGFWGRKLADLGVGTQPIPRKQLTTNRLAHAIEQAVSDTIMQQKASELGAKIHNEDGIANAVNIINEIIGQPTAM